VSGGGSVVAGRKASMTCNGGGNKNNRDVIDGVDVIGVLVPEKSSGFCRVQKPHGLTVRRRKKMFEI
jgi:hypothetical protein